MEGCVQDLNSGSNWRSSWREESRRHEWRNESRRCESWRTESVRTESWRTESWRTESFRKNSWRRDMPGEGLCKNNPSLEKFWRRRYHLFSRYDEGIRLDEESWYSVTPEGIAKNIAERCKCDTIVDGFCGAGGNAIQFAFTCKKVIAIDIDAQKIQLAKNNAKVYGVDHKIDFVIGDFFNLAKTLTADVVFLSPPWGGPSYLQQNDWYDLNIQLQPQPINVLIDAARNISQNIAIYLPKNSNTTPLFEACRQGEAIEIHSNRDSIRVVAITAFFNNLAVM